MNQTERIGRFEVQERLRSNAFAIIYRGRDPFDGRRVQIKFCVATDEGIRHRFLAAAERAALLRHPNIATVFEYGSGDSKPYLVQEAFSEETLSDLLARREPIEDVLKLYYLMQIARGLQYAHSREVLHRELRPAAVMVDRSGEAKLADFGTARLASAFAQLGNGAHRWPAVGWLLPELLLGLDLDTRSDIYGFGALAFEVLTGRPPYVAETLSELVPQILETDPQPVGVHWPECPPDLDRLILRCMSRDPGRRFASMDQVLEEFDQVIPVPEPPDYVEQERTLVIEDMQPVAFADTDEIPVPQVEELPAPVTLEAFESSDSHGPEPVSEAHGQVEESAGVDWRAVGHTIRNQLVTTSSAVGTAVGRASKAATGWIHSIEVSKLGNSVRPARLRTFGIIIGALLLSGVVGWSVAREPEEILALPVVAPQLPGQMQEMNPTGVLVVDAQPWGEVVRIVDDGGTELGLPENRFTPVPFELEPGRYTIEVSRPELDEVHACEVVIEADTTARCEPRIASLEVNDLFRQTGWWQ